jgi:type I restriction enzyme M protein
MNSFYETNCILVPKSKIAENGDYNLTGDRYRETMDYSNAKWPMVELGEIIQTITPPNKIQKGDFKSSGKYPIIDQSQDEIAGWTDDENSLVKSEKDLVVFGDHTCVIKYVNFPFVQGADGIKILKTKDDLLPKFLFFSLKTRPLKSDGYQRHFTKLKLYKIPLPPLSIQEQIVAEIEQYQKVIDGAKQVIKNWKPSFRIDLSWEMVELGEVCEIFGGGTPSRAEKTFWNGDIPWITAKYFTDNHTISGFENITEEGLKNSSSKIAPKGSTIVITRVSVGKFAYADRYYAINQDLTALVPNTKKINEGFLLVISSTVAKEIEKNAVGMGVKGVTRDFVIKQKIPLPPLPVQEQIVAEIEAEQKAIDECKKLIEKMQKKIKAKISEVWGEDS